jgi:hypothetical protein
LLQVDNFSANCGSLLLTIVSLVTRNPTSSLFVFMVVRSLFLRKLLSERYQMIYDLSEIAPIEITDHLQTLLGYGDGDGECLA